MAEIAINQLGGERVGDLAALVSRALPDEGLSADELLACCWEDPGVVLATPDGTGAVAAVVRRFGDLAEGFVKLIAVAPEDHRRGLGRTLLDAAVTWAFDEGASGVGLGGSAPFYLWPGVDSSNLAMTCLAEAAGFQPVGSEVDMLQPTGFRAQPPEGVDLFRVVEQDDLSAVQAFVGRNWPWWLFELGRAFEQGGCIGAREDGEVIGFACHSVNRAGWVGPMGTEPGKGRGGVGHALLGRLCEDMAVAGIEVAEVAWVGPVRFYAKAGARMGRCFRTYRLARP